MFMEYTYLLETMTNKTVTARDLSLTGNTNVIYMLCYHVEERCQYPFLQFMMEKTPFCDNLVKEQFSLPHVVIRENTKDIKHKVLEKIRYCFSGKNVNITDDMYVGFFSVSSTNIPYVLVNLTSLEINGNCVSRDEPYWFALATEIMNTGSVCNIPVDNEVTRLFVENPQIATLVNPRLKQVYTSPDAVYTGDEFTTVEFNSIFGNQKTKIYDSCGEYYYFYASFQDAVYSGGWYNPMLNADYKRVVENSCGKYVKGGINRYALFPKGELYVEKELEFSLTDEIISKLYTNKCVYICYSDKRTNPHTNYPNLLVQNDNCFMSLSYHLLDKELLGDSYDSRNGERFMIL